MSPQNGIPSSFVLGAVPHLLQHAYALTNCALKLCQSTDFPRLLAPCISVAATIHSCHEPKTGCAVGNPHLIVFILTGHPLLRNPNRNICYSYFAPRALTTLEGRHRAQFKTPDPAIDATTSYTFNDTPSSASPASSRLTRTSAAIRPSSAHRPPLSADDVHDAALQLQRPEPHLRADIRAGYLYFTRYNDKLLVKLLFFRLAPQLPHFGAPAPLEAVTKILTFTCVAGRTGITGILTEAHSSSQMYFVYQLYMVKLPAHLHHIMTAAVGVLATVNSVRASSPVYAIPPTDIQWMVGCMGIRFIHPQAIFMNRNHTFSILTGLAKGFGTAVDDVATLAMCMFVKSAETGITRTSACSSPRAKSSSSPSRPRGTSTVGMLNARTSLQDKYGARASCARKSLVIGGRAGADPASVEEKMPTNFFCAVVTNLTSSQVGDLALGDPTYALGEIRVTTSSTVTEI
ncbi:hypothetical protein C8J57DRAFT_1222349 [Mycena rebaudengoi]|nr:hypothetical protein C8J57DRAFT_1222349 [Mycena rebaudengoi]